MSLSRSKIPGTCHLSLVICNLLMVSPLIYLDAQIMARKQFLKKFFILFLIAPILLAGCKKSGTPEDENYKAGVVHLETFEYSLAIQKFKDSINQNPSNTDSYIQAADILQRKGDLDEALLVLNNGIDFAEEAWKLLQKTGDIYMTKKDYVQAEDNYRKSLNRGGDWKSAVGLSKSLVLQQKYEDAESILRSHKTDDSEGRVRLGYLLAALQSKDFDLSLETITSLGTNLAEDELLNNLNNALTAAKESEENKIEDYMNIAFVIIGGGDFEFAFHLLEEVILENEYYHGGQLYSGYVYLKIEDYGKSKDFLLTALQLNSSDVDTLKFLAQTYLGLNEQKNAVDIYLSLLALSPNDTEIKRDYIEALITSDSMEKAKEQAAALVNLDPSIENRVLFAEILVELGDFDGAGKQLELAREVEEFESIAGALKAKHMILEGWTLYKKGEKALGLELLEDSLKLTSSSPLSYFYLGIIYKDTGKSVDAKTSLERAIDLDFDGDIASQATTILNSL
ncbi:MAG TPA: hypothetical protein ENI23_09965 [bacterium]|nr:hypothetical protein [bacterium]